MNRRTFAAALGVGLIAPPRLARSQGRKMARIGWVGGWYSRSAAQSLFDAFRQGMRDLGYVEGQNLAIEARSMEGTGRDEAVRLTAELVRTNVDVLVAQGMAITGVKAEAGTVPVVFGYSGDPVAAKLVASLARPGGNATGTTLMASDLARKRVGLLKEVAPSVSRLGALVNPLHVGEDGEFIETEAAARRLGLTVQQYPVRTVTEVNAALDAMAHDRIDGIVALSNLLIMLQRSVIADFALRNRIPTISGWQDFALDGNLMSYGPNLQDAWRHVATYVDKILRGAKPADLPVEQPTSFQLVINLKTAKALRLTISQSLLLRADRVID